MTSNCLRQSSRSLIEFASNESRDQIMAKKVFFSFHYQDVIDFRANVVRQHWQMKPDREAAGFFDKSVWETAKGTNPTAVKRLIHSALDGTSVTCILAGSNTYERPWVRYEIMKSFRKGNHLLAVHINSIAGKDKATKPKGPNPLDYLGVSYSATGDTGTLYQVKNGKWEEFKEIDNSASFRTDGIHQRYWGNGYKFSLWYPAYDWVADDGYNRFATWIQ